VVAAGLRLRVGAVRRLLDFAPRVVVRDGRVDLPASPLGPQLTADELWSKLREKGVTTLEAYDWW
jgi:uncharacterized membrane protein YcaP (DUF421 family)